MGVLEAVVRARTLTSMEMPGMHFLSGHKILSIQVFLLFPRLLLSFRTINFNKILPITVKGGSFYFVSPTVIYPT